MGELVVLFSPLSVTDRVGGINSDILDTFISLTGLGGRIGGLAGSVLFRVVIHETIGSLLRWLLSLGEDISINELVPSEHDTIVVLRIGEFGCDK